MPLHLISRRPSPTTASFTVSNASRHTSTAAKLFFYFQILLRVNVFSSVLFLFAARFRHTFFIQDGSFVPWTAVWSSPMGSHACDIADTTNFAIFALTSALVMYGVFRKGYTGSSLLSLCRFRFVLINSTLRGITVGYPRSRHSDIYLFSHLPIQSCDKIHSDDRNPRHCYT
ncbi:hypothetical protein BDW59DRAFT_834 [Aspergillus cavernicola]|uniref:Glucose receptor Git3 N-terminal domain-containing protein n=1 Tax=Aspergillus cavernicola TaxID=176166 RepID=A0ABR4J4C3_9EURO